MGWGGGAAPLLSKPIYCWFHPTILSDSDFTAPDAPDLPSTSTALISHHITQACAHTDFLSHKDLFFSRLHVANGTSVAHFDNLFGHH